MSVLYCFDKTGGFMTCDTKTGRTAYAYVTSPRADKALKDPDTTAARMMQIENAHGAWRDAKHFRVTDAKRVRFICERNTLAAVS